MPRREIEQIGRFGDFDDAGSDRGVNIIERTRCLVEIVACDNTIVTNQILDAGVDRRSQNDDVRGVDGGGRFQRAQPGRAGAEPGNRDQAHLRQPAY